jgi:hypothetical protein
MTDLRLEFGNCLSVAQLRGRGTGGGGMGGCAFFKVKKVPFFLERKNEKSLKKVFLERAPSFSGKKVPFSQ